MIVALDNKTDIEHICQQTNGAWLQQSNNTPINELCIDTRKIAHPEAALFVALTTNLRDGHSYISDAYNKGIRNFLVSNKIDTSEYKDANFILVADTLASLQAITTAHRQQFNIPCIGITGSNGKTIVKEWLNQLLTTDYNIVRSPKSYNSQIGVPLSVWLMDSQHQLAIFEAGISKPDEMVRLEPVIQPTIGIFTNIGEAHSEGFESIEQKAAEKLQLFSNVKQLIYCKDNSIVDNSIRQSSIKAQLFSWSAEADADLQITSTETIGINTRIAARYQNKEVEITIPFSDSASIENAIHCWCALLLLDIPQSTIAERMLSLTAVHMRLEVKHGINDCTFINDTYNSDLTSLLIALEYLEQQKQHKKHTLILSDMLQIARPEEALYKEVARLVKRKHLQRFIGIGAAITKYKDLFESSDIETLFFNTTDEFLQEFHLLHFEDEAILLKGARAFTFERISSLLEQKTHQTTLSINLSAVTHNLNVYRSKLKKGVKTMAMVKAFSYGSGSYEIAHRLQYAGVDYLAVAYTDEGIELRKAGITIPIMVMSPDTMSFDRMIAWNLEPELFNMRSIHAFSSIAQSLDLQQYSVHIKLDTGMHRLGFEPEDMTELVNALQQNHHLNVVSIFSHLSASEEAIHDDFTNQQAALFTQMADELSNALSISPIRHICNSTGIVRHPQLHYDMVRVGLGLYGLDSSNTIQKELQQTGTLTTTIAQIKNVPAGESVGYGKKGIADKDRRTATISIGYADGYPRALNGTEAYVLIHNQPAKIVGNICMDMCMVDVTDIPQAKEGDSAVVFGNSLPITLLASWSNTISYEMMTNISQRVKRIYENEA